MFLGTFLVYAPFFMMLVKLQKFNESSHLFFLLAGCCYGGAVFILQLKDGLLQQEFAHLTHISHARSVA